MNIQSQFAIARNDTDGNGKVFFSFYVKRNGTVVWTSDLAEADIRNADDEAGDRFLVRVKDWDKDSTGIRKVEIKWSYTVHDVE